MAKNKRITRSNPTGAKCPDHPSAQVGTNGCNAKGCTFSVPPAPPREQIVPGMDAHKG